MSSNSFLVDLRKSMIIANPQHFPMNMEKTAKEDYPVETYPIVAYDAKNVVPTPFGYKSFFEESTRLNIGNLTGKFVQKIFNYQTVNMDSVQFALCEDGIYVAFATEPTPANWALIVDLSATMVTGLRRLWTVAVISNVVYLYQAGQPKFWAIVDPAKYAEAASPSLIAGATRSQVWTNWATGLISYIPSFLNMAGQIGLFRADNRLGFWDSDNSVGWSSSVAIEDFKPDAKTFAGSTKFADVQGRIVKILGSGDNFVIYATRSIVNCIGLDNSPEKWRGEAIMSEVGVSFDSQIAAAQPDQIHYCITQAGLCAITAGNPEYIATEVMDYIAENFALYSLSLIEGRYLFISVNGVFPSSSYGTESHLIKDFDNNAFLFPRPVYSNISDDYSKFLADYIAGREASLQEALKDYAPIVDVSTIPPDQPLEPCFDIKTFDSTWANTTFTPINKGTELLDSKITLGVTYILDPLRKDPVVTVNSVTHINQAPGDFAMEDAVAKVEIGMSQYNKQVDYQNNWTNANAAPIPVDITDTGPIPDGFVGEPIIKTWERKLVDRRNLPNCVDSRDLKAKVNECRTRLYLDKDRLFQLSTYFEGTESYKGGVFPFFAPGGTNGIPTVDAPALTYPKSVILCGVSEEIEGAFRSRYLEVRGSSFPFGTIAPFGELHWAYVTYLAVHHPELVESTTMPAERIVALSTAIAAEMAFNPDYYQLMSVDINPFVFGHYQGMSAWYELFDGATYTRPLAINGHTSGKWDYYSKSENGGQYCGFGPYSNGSPNFYFGLTSIVFLEWEEGEKAPYKAIANGNPKYRLVGQLVHDVQLLENFEADWPVFELELSGWGYTPSGGFSFRKTHSRHSSTSCPTPTSGQSVALNGNAPLPKLPPLDMPEDLNAPVVWKYPTSIPLPDNYALFQKGSLGAYYPTYGAAAVYDLLLQKWGMYNNSHKLIQELMPVNRVDSSIMPVLDTGMFAGALNPASECTVFKDLNPQSFITYGKMAFYRRGMSLATGAIAHFGNLATGTLIVEASMDGVTVDPLLSYAVPFVNQRNVTLPFTTRAKWFNIRVEGNFNLTYLELLAESRGRR